MSVLQFNVNLISANLSVINSFTMEVPIIKKNNALTDLLCKSVDWFLYDRELFHEKVSWVFTPFKIGYRSSYKLEPIELISFY